MEILETTVFGKRDITYGFLTEAEVKELDNALQDSQVIISHVGDGEYSHNIFGNVFSNYTEALKSYKAKYDSYPNKRAVESTVCIIQERYPDIDRINYYVGHVRNDWKTAKYNHPTREGYLTVEQLDDDFQGGY